MEGPVDMAVDAYFCALDPTKRIENWYADQGSFSTGVWSYTALAAQ
ncbi:MAG: hypothetical protein AAGH82_06785 [Pseudomonadota bacterium]